MQAIPAFMAARGLARSLDDRQRALLAALASHPDAATLFAEAAGESRRYRSFGHDRFDDEDILLLSTLDYALRNCHADGARVVQGILERWDDMTDDMQSHIAGRVDLAIRDEEPGIGVGATADAWQSVVDRSLGASPGMR